MRTATKCRTCPESIRSTDIYRGLCGWCWEDLLVRALTILKVGSTRRSDSAFAVFHLREDRGLSTTEVLRLRVQLRAGADVEELARGIRERQDEAVAVG